MARLLSRRRAISIWPRHCSSTAPNRFIQGGRPEAGEELKRNLPAGPGHNDPGSATSTAQAPSLIATRKHRPRHRRHKHREVSCAAGRVRPGGKLRQEFGEDLVRLVALGGELRPVTPARALPSVQAPAQSSKPRRGLPDQTGRFSALLSRTLPSAFHLASIGARQVPTGAM
jgi:hypothetical protein